MADEKLTAATRIEKLLDNIAGGDNDVTPATRLEKFLSYIADAMEGGGSGGGSGGGGESVINIVDTASWNLYDSEVYDPANFYAYHNGTWTNLGSVIVYKNEGQFDLTKINIARTESDSLPPLMINGVYTNVLPYIYSDTIGENAGSALFSEPGWYLRDSTNVIVLVYSLDDPGMNIFLPENASVVYYSGSIG